MERLLVTTALEETWGGGAPVIFLGEWCRLYSRKSIWSGMDALVADPFGVEPEKKLRDIVYVDDLTNQILTELSEAFNKYHMVQYSERYWNVLFGHWLKRYVKVAFNRYYTLDQALKNYKVLGTAIIKDDNFHLATPDSRSFIYMCDDNRWNHVFYSRIMTFRGDVDLNSTFVHSENVSGIGDEKKDKCGFSEKISGMTSKLLDAVATRGMGFIIARLLERLIGAIGVKLGSDTDAFIISTYLPVKEEIKLQFALGQIPQIWRLPVLNETKADPRMRVNLKLNYKNFGGFENFVRWQLPEVVPACYLEGYKNLVKRAEEIPWPKSPKFIFTSNSFDTVEIFKAWTASKVEQGIPYFAGQHGNNYGTHVAQGNRCWPDRATSDKFFTWGWAESKKDIPTFMFTCAGKKPRQFDSDGGLLLVEMPLFVDSYTYDKYYDQCLYMEEQFCFAENLPKHINQSLTVRLHAQYKNMRFFEDLRWRDRCPHTKIELGIINIRELIKQSRLVVHSYDSTGILETLAMNIPTMCFWRDGLSHLLPSAKPYYELLADAGILFFSPEATAKSIVLHWDDISGWWGSKKVQDARQIFCNQYAKIEKHPVRTLKRLLTSN